jgi:hypothetical protein
MTLCEAIEEFELTENFEYMRIGKNLNSLVVNLEDELFRYNSFVLIQDSINDQIHQLNQIDLSTFRFGITEQNFQKLKLKTEELIEHFTSKFGEPTKSVINEDNFWSETFQKGFDTIIMAVWDKDEIKFQIDFTITGEHKLYKYQIRIHKFKDYWGNMKLPPWWNGYEYNPAGNK